MKFIKKCFSAVLALTMLLSLAACGQKAQNATQPPVTTETSSETAPSTQVLTETQTAQAEASGKVLVVYFSASGHTGSVAEYIRTALSADIFQITPAESYSAADLDWTDGNSRVSREHNDPALQTVALTTTQVDGWENYDTVFVGYPIWWGGAAWPVSSFVAANDFTGKTVIPFATSSSSGLGQSAEQLAQLAGTGNWLDGQRFRSSTAQADVENWVKGLKF